MDLKIVEAGQSDIDFIVFANREIDKASYIESSMLSQNIKKDILEEHMAVCLIAKDNDKYVGMVLFSKVYWADRGEGIYVSQCFVNENYRRRGIFKKLIKTAFEYYENTQFLTCLVARKNAHMIDCMHNLSFEDESMISYVKNKDDFYKII